MNDIIYIMGVSGSGKTTIGKLLSHELNLPFFDADDFHSEKNKEKMKTGNPLTDEDRHDWLQQINKLAIDQSKKRGAIIACSALKKKYREVLSKGIDDPCWISLTGSYETVLERLKKRNGHYMPPGLLQSQFEILEMPENALTVNINNTADDIVTTIMNYLNRNK